jgi:hypothetical protein
MYNLLVTAAEGAWNLPAYEYDRTRFLEYTAESLKAKFQKLNAAAIEELKSLPSLFTYEGADEQVRIGYIRQVRERDRGILIEYEFDENIQPFRFSILAPLKLRLDIKSREMSRTHWAVKDEELFQILSSVRIVDGSYEGDSRLPGRIEEMRFKVAFSFPGEKRDFVSTVAAEVKRLLGSDAVFYDKDFTAQLARPNLDTLLQRIYRNSSDLVVVFLCSDYDKKQWCGLEWRAIRTIIKNKNDHAIMFMRFDQADVGGSFSIDGYVDLDEHGPLEAARMIIERVRLNAQPTGNA